MVVHLDDLLRRRMPLLILAKMSDSDLRWLATIVAPVMGWNVADIDREIEICRDVIHHAHLPGHEQIKA